jgi:DNA polymerase-3 subunit beta
VKTAIQGVLLPARNVPDVLRTLEGVNEVEVRVGENQCSFFSENGFATSRLIDGAFPDYKAIIPKDSVASATCLKEDAVSVFKKVAIFTDSFNHVHLSFKPSDKVFTVRAANTPTSTADRPKRKYAGINDIKAINKNSPKGDFRFLILMVL